jgi:hypothetical protein
MVYEYAGGEREFNRWDRGVELESRAFDPADATQISVLRAAQDAEVRTASTRPPVRLHVPTARISGYCANCRERHLTLNGGQEQTGPML